MSDNDTSKIRYDDFISNIQPDPAKPESTIMLSGFVGHGPEGHARVYPDPTLGTWYDIPEGDVIHSMPIPDSKLGGSYIWVRANSEIKPGNAAPAAAETESVQPQAAAAINPTPRTHCHVCDPPVAMAAMQATPTPATHCFICPPQGPAGGQAGTFHFTNWCSLVGCNPATNGCGVAAGVPQAAPHGAPGVLPQTHFLCTQGLATFCGCTPGIDCNAPPGNVQTQAPICTQGFPTFCGCTPGFDCMGLAARAAPQQANATAVTVCVTDCAPPANQMMRAAVGNPMDPTPQSRCFVCDQPNMLAAMQPTPTAQTYWFICPPVNQTLATVCTQIGCPTHQIHCPTQPVVCNLQPTQPVVCGVLPPSFGCTQHGCQQQGGAPQQLEGVMAAPAHPNTAATLCTQPPACPPRTVHNSLCICPTPSAVHQCGGPVHPTLATLCTLPPACPPHTVHNSMCICPTPSAVHQCGGQTFTPTIPQFTVVGACPTFGVCPSMACTPMTPVQNGVFTPFGR